MKFSIIIPIYNASKYMDACVQSVLSQSYQDFEIILVDDGSTDTSPDKCDRYKKNNCKVKVIHKNNGGPTSARKMGALASVGEYIICIDSDDYINSKYLEYCASLIDMYSPDCLCFGYRSFDQDNVLELVINHTDEGLYCEETLNDLTGRLLYDKESAEMNSGVLLFSIWSKVVKREIFVQAQLEIPDSMFFGEDVVLSLKCVKNSKSVFVSHNAFYHYRITENSITNRFTPEKFSQIEMVATQLLKISGESNSLYVFCLYSILGEIYNAAQNLSLKKYRDVVKAIPENCPISYPFSLTAVIKKTTWKYAVKAFLYRRRMFICLYILFRKQK